MSTPVQMLWHFTFTIILNSICTQTGSEPHPELYFEKKKEWSVVPSHIPHFWRILSMSESGMDGRQLSRE